MRFGTWNVSSLYRAGSLTAAGARELARYKLDLVGVQEVRCDKGGNGKSRGLVICMWKKNMSWSGQVARTGGQERCIQGFDGES